MLLNEPQKRGGKCLVLVQNLRSILVQLRLVIGGAERSVALRPFGVSAFNVDNAVCVGIVIPFL
jgi:hypothetical protein